MELGSLVDGSDEQDEGEKLLELRVMKEVLRLTSITWRVYECFVKIETFA